MTTYLRIILSFFVITFMIYMLRLIAKRLLSLKYSLLWLGVCFVLVMLLVFPELLFFVAAVLHVELPINALFLFGIFILMLISLSLTVIVSKLTLRIRSLSQECALLEHRLRTIELGYEKNLKELEEKK